MNLTDKEKGIAIIIAIVGFFLFIIVGRGFLPFIFLILLVLLLVAIYFLFIYFIRKIQNGSLNIRFFVIYIIWGVIHFSLLIAGVFPLNDRPGCGPYCSLYPIFSPGGGDVWIDFRPRLSYDITDLLFYMIIPIVFYYAYKLIKSK